MTLGVIEAVVLATLLVAGFVGAFFFGERRNKRAAIDAEAYKRLLEGAEAERADALEKYAVAEAAREAAEKEVVRAEEEMRALKAQMADWEKTKEEHREAVKASVLESTRAISNKLLDDHKREAEAHKRESEKRVKETTVQLQQQFERVFGSMDTLFGQIKELEVVRQAFLHPSGAGDLGEVILKNIFEASTLRENQDYFLQYVVEGPKGNVLKPDAVVSLPGNSVMLVDSKASKFFLELAEAERSGDAETVKHAEAGLKRSMQEHLKGLEIREYKEAFEWQGKKGGKAMGQMPVGDVTLLMFIPSESALERLRQLDPAFMERAWKAQIVPVGPAGLVNELLRSRMLIANAKQEEHFEEIRAEVMQLLKSVGTLHGHSDELGRGIKSLFQKYDRLAGSFNRTFIASVKRLDQWGISLPKDKELQRLNRYQFVTQDIEGDGAALEDEAAESGGADVKKIEKLAG